MPVSSVVIEKDRVVRLDGTRRIIALYTMHTGEESRASFRLPDGVNAQTFAESRNGIVENQYSNIERRKLPQTTDWSAGIEKHNTARQIQEAYAGHFLKNKVDPSEAVHAAPLIDSLNDTQVAALFGKPASEIRALNTRLKRIRQDTIDDKAERAR